MQSLVFREDTTRSVVQLIMPELPFDLFDPETDVDISERQLPHWFQPGVITFVTFRTADSIPQCVLQLWLEELRDWFRQRGVMVPPTAALPKVKSLPAELQGPYRQKRFHKWNEHLDDCYSECHLRKRELAENGIKAKLPPTDYLYWSR